jgi:hypothetical protein
MNNSRCVRRNKKGARNNKGVGGDLFTKQIEKVHALEFGITPLRKLMCLASFHDMTSGMTNSS